MRASASHSHADDSTSGGDADADFRIAMPEVSRSRTYLVSQIAETLAHVGATLGAVIITFIGDEESEGLARRVPSGSGSSPLVSAISARSR